MTPTAPPYGPDATTYHMSETVNYTHLIIAVGVVLIIALGFWSICDDVERKAEVQGTAEWWFANRDQHTADVRWQLRKARRHGNPYLAAIEAAAQHTDMTEHRATGRAA